MRIRTTINISANQRAWYRQKHKPTVCRYCRKLIVFMKDLHGNEIPCDAVKKIVNEKDVNGSIKVMDEEGIISTVGRRIGWPVHDCTLSPVQHSAMVKV